MIRVALIDDHASFRDALAFMLERETDLSITGQAGSLADADVLVRTTPVDVALVDLDLPDGYGLDLLPALREHTPEAAAIVLSGSKRPENPAMAVAAGAAGFVSKEVGTVQIVEAIRRVTSGEMLFSAPQAVSLMRDAAQYQARTRANRAVLDHLTNRERDVLRALAAGLDNQAIADRYYLSSATVRTHVGQVLRKLGVDSRLQAALVAVRYGLVDLEEPD